MDNKIPYNQASSAPTAKVAAGGIGGALTIILVFALGEFDIVVPPEVASALTTIVGFASAYYTRDKKPVPAVRAIIKERKG